MRSYETAAQILFIASIVSSTLATFEQKLELEPEAQVARGLTGPEIGKVIKTEAMKGFMSGQVNAVGALLELAFIHNYITNNNNNASHRRSPVTRDLLFPLRDRTSRRNQQASHSLGLAGLSDEDLRSLSVFTRRAIEDLD